VGHGRREPAWRGYDYRETVAPWFRGIFMLTPHVGEMAHAPLIYRIHPMCVMAVLALWPFNPLVHAASGTLHYLRRAIAEPLRDVT
jgi:nitrate reductase gamma subunit